MIGAPAGTDPSGRPASSGATSRSITSRPAPTESRSSSTCTTRGLLTAWPSSRPAAPEETTTESAPPCSSRCAFSLSRTDATIRARGLSSRAVSVMRTALSSRSGATTTAAASRTPAASSADEALASATTPAWPARRASSAASARSSITTIASALDPVREERLDGGAALDAVAADDGVILQGPPPALLAVVGAGALGQHLERRRHKDDEEQHAGRHHDEDVDEPGAVGHRRDVAVAGRRHADRAEVERVERADLVRRCRRGSPRGRGR